MISRGIWVLSAAFLAATLSCAAQFSYSFRADGPNYMAPDAPFTATRVTRLETRLQNGSVMQHEVREMLSRNAQGQLYLRATPVLADALSTPRQQFLIADPVAGTVFQWQTGASSGIAQKMPALRHLDIHIFSSQSALTTHPPKSATVTTEDLGEQQIAGLKATGTRTTMTLPANAIGNSEPLRVVHEVWTSEDLHIPLRELDINPLTGTRTMNTEKIEPNAGPVALFHAPPGINFVARDFNLDDIKERLAFTKAMDEIKAPETREAAADVLVRYAATHPEEANHVAHTLAIRDTHLDDAKRLGEESVQRMEQTAAKLSLGDATAGSFHEMFELAEYWDSLGSVYAALGDSGTAERYFRDAWSLGGEGLYLDHIAVMQSHAGDKTAALHTLHVALSGKMDDRETDQVKRRAERLGEENPQATPEPLTVNVAGAKGDGSADFLLLFTGSGTPSVQFLNGADALKSDAKAIAAATFPPQLPDSGPEHILRRAHLECSAQTGCSLSFLYAWQAEDAEKAGLRSGSPATLLQ